MDVLETIQKYKLNSLCIQVNCYWILQAKLAFWVLKKQTSLIIEPILMCYGSTTVHQ